VENPASGVLTGDSVTVGSADDGTCSCGADVGVTGEFFVLRNGVGLPIQSSGKQRDFRYATPNPIASGSTIKANRPRPYFRKRRCLYGVEFRDVVESARSGVGVSGVAVSISSFLDENFEESMAGARSGDSTA
jgi:hypothetical protein